MKNLLEQHGLYAVDYFKSPISGGSLVVVASKKKDTISKNLKKLIEYEKNNKINSEIYWKNFKQKCLTHKILLRETLHNFLRKKNKLSGYGASARSSTLLNFCNINNKHLDLIFDKNILKDNLYTAGSNIMIKQPKIRAFRGTNCIVILAWNFKDEIIRYLKKEIKFKGFIIIVLPRIKIIKC